MKKQKKKKLTHMMKKKPRLKHNEKGKRCTRPLSAMFFFMSDILGIASVFSSTQDMLSVHLISLTLSFC